MFMAVHAAVGAVAGNAVINPVTAFALGFFSHFFTDMVPHGDEKMYYGFKNGERVYRALLYVGLDAVATIIIVAFIFLKQDFFSPVSVAAGIAGSLLPDLVVGLAEVLKPKGQRWLSRKLDGFRRFHMSNHHAFIARFRKGERDIPLKYGLMLQAAVLTTLLKLIF